MDFADDDIDFSLNDLTLQLNTENWQNQGSVLTGSSFYRGYVIGKVIIDSESESEDAEYDVYQNVNVQDNQTTEIANAEETDGDQQIERERYVGFNLPSDCKWNPRRVNGMKQGDVTVYSKDNQIRVTCSFENDKLNGTCTFYNNGMREEERPYINDVAEGWSKQYSDGDVTSFIHYENGYKTEMYQKGEGDFWLFRKNTFPKSDDEICTFSCHFDQVTYKRVGIVYGFNGRSELKEAVEYRDGEPDRTVKTFDNDKMKEYDTESNIIYDGDYLKDIKKGYPRDGIGEEYKNNCKLYDGKWVENRKEGNGSSYANNKCRYRGEWKDDLPDGEGKLMDSEGYTCKYKGIWNKGRFTIDSNTYYDYTLDRVVAGQIMDGMNHSEGSRNSQRVPLPFSAGTIGTFLTVKTRRDTTIRNSNGSFSQSSIALPRNGVIDAFSVPSDDNTSVRSSMSIRQDSRARVVDIPPGGDTQLTTSTVSIPLPDSRSTRSRDSNRLPETPVVRPPPRRVPSSHNHSLNHSEGSLMESSSPPPSIVTPRSPADSRSNTLRSPVKKTVPSLPPNKVESPRRKQVPDDVSSDLEEELTQPEKPQETQPVKPQETQPVKPQETQPVKPQETQPVKPQETQPVIPQETQPVILQKKELLPIPEDKEDALKTPEMIPFVVGDGLCNDYTELVLENKASTSVIMIGSGSYQNASRFVVSNLSHVTSLTVGKNSFNNCEFGSVDIKDCPKLTTITIEEGSFMQFHECLLTNLPSLEKIVIDSYVFYGSETKEKNSRCQLTSLPKLKTVSMKEMNFFFTNKLILKNVPRFEFSASNPFQRIKTIDTGDYGQPSCLNLRQVPHLDDSFWLKKKMEYVIFDSYTGNQKSLKSLVIKHFKKLKLIKFNYYCFRNLSDLRILHNPELEMVYVGFNCFDGEMKDGYLKIVDCKSLKQVYCMKNAFSHYTDCDLIDLPDLVQVDFNESFKGNKRKRKNTLEMKELPSLSCITFENSFFYTSHVTIINVPSIDILNTEDYGTNFGFIKKSKLKNASRFHEIQALQSCC